ncbi:MAG: hypothetical protein US86_C0001G0331 [Candidatus Daviesbacteria bacterium GW2011_GWA2_38_24]|uniref:D-isomer specific 2-hydroxyacid dehydrogenase NAD-binding protein n=1 Tax=Candidatus Daviesbacteria bacterium GW2011_GWA2_38_24 TaxID=1618422 RepID=A0A0G0M167_9BACT|nr:MAG: hypothetical protein US86_C0001G0331 [Candidatus Daviesbacteria bacterium GW2011_GWA2_38_24]OGE23703.1 MAG: hypothetical protein A2688_01015 [Candidatus Daviesbacteria bacterium RIFCSPHIGHO2_01_FULL_38_8]
MKIAFFEIRPGEQELLEEGLRGHSLKFFEDPLNETNIQDVLDFDVISTHSKSKVTSAVIEKLNNLKLVATRTTGFDHIDLQKCKEKNIVVCNVPAYGEITVAEYAFALILNVSRKIYQGVYNIKEKNNFDTNSLEGFDLNEKTLGVIGTGRIGQHVINLTRGFNMKVIAFDAFPRPELQEKLNFKYVSLEQLLSTSDVITLHVPYLPSTHHLINSANINKIKKGAILVNTSRGGVIETKTLVDALENKILSAAGLDVFEEEYEIANNQNTEAVTLVKKLISMENCIVTPHNAFNSIEARTRIEQTTIENINNFLKDSLTNIVS